MLEFWKPPTMDDVRAGEDLNKFKVVSMFAGLGGSSTGYRLAGGKVLAVNEFIDYRQTTYAKNYPTTPVWPEDIRKLTGEEILRRTGLKKGELDILDGSPPCSDFSTNNMGTREQKWGKVKNYSNTTQRVDDLFYEFARIITEVQPKVFIAENVKGLVIGSAKQILGSESSLSKFVKSEDAHTLKGLTGQDATILEALKACGYKVSYKVMKASEYGIPQIRERLIFMGVRNDLPFNPSFPKAMERYLIDPIVGKDAIGEFLFNGANVPLNPETMTCQYIKNYFPPHCTKKMVLDIMKKNDLHTFAHRYHRDTWNKVFYTIVSQDGNNTTHSIVDRYNSVCEGQRIQAFPDDYEFDMYPSKRIKVSISDLENPHFTSKLRYKWFHAGHESVDVKKPTIKDLIALTGWDYDKIRDDKVFSIDTEVDYEWDKKQYQHSSRVWESIGRAVPPLLHKVVAEHVYSNILSKL